MVGGVQALGHLDLGGYVRTLSVKGTHSGLISVRRGMGTARLGNLNSALLVVGENTSSVNVSGYTKGSVLSFGTYIGPDGIYNTTDDVITGGSVRTATFAGTFQDSAMVAGVLPNLNNGPGIPSDMRSFAGNPTAADVHEIDSAEAGGVLESRIDRLSIRGNIINTSPWSGKRSVVAAANEINRMSLGVGGPSLLTRVYGDPFGAPTISDVKFVNNSNRQFIFSEQINTASLILSQDLDGDGSLTGLADVLGTVLVRDQSGNVINDVKLGYSTQEDDEGAVHGVLHITKPGLFDGTQNISVELSGTDVQYIYDRSGMRSALRDINQDGTPAVGEDQPGTIFDGDMDGNEYGNF